MPKRAVFERSRLELSSGVSVGVHIFLVVERSSLESQSRGCAKTPIFRVIPPHGRSHAPRRVGSDGNGMGCMLYGTYGIDTPI